MKGIQAEAGVDAYIIEGEAKAGFKVFGLNIDARAIIAIAIAESSLGTQGVATAPGANMFGFGAFDNNTTNAQNFSDDKAVIKMTQETIIQNQNTSFAIQDQKAQLLSTGNLNVAARGGVYCTDASGSGKRRAAIMESIDKWIDAHGGISEISKELLNTSSVAMMAVPTSYLIKRATMWQALTLGANALGTSLTAPKNLATSLDHLWVMVAIGKISRAIKPHTRQKQATPSHLAPAKLVLIELTATWPSSKTLRKTDLS